MNLLEAMRVGLRYELLMIAIYERQLALVSDHMVKAQIQKVLADEHRHKAWMAGIIEKATGKKEKIAVESVKKQPGSVDLRGMMHADMVFERDVEAHYMKLIDFEGLDEETKKVLAAIRAETMEHANKFKHLQDYASRKKA